jgi:hypothetical protein
MFEGFRPWLHDLVRKCAGVVDLSNGDSHSECLVELFSRAKERRMKDDRHKTRGLRATAAQRHALPQQRP